MPEKTIMFSTRRAAEVEEPPTGIKVNLVLLLEANEVPAFVECLTEVYKQLKDEDEYVFYTMAGYVSLPNEAK